MSQLPDSVREAFAAAGLPAPSPDRVDDRGYSAAEVAIIERHRARLARLAVDNQG